MRVQIRDHAANGAFHQLPVVDRFDIIFLDAIHHFGKQTRLFPAQIVVFDRTQAGDELTAKREAKAQYGADDQHQHCSGFQCQKRPRLAAAARCEPPVIALPKIPQGRRP